VQPVLDRCQNVMIVPVATAICALAVDAETPLFGVVSRGNREDHRPCGFHDR
jgi:hypothetical protein